MILELPINHQKFNQDMLYRKFLKPRNFVIIKLFIYISEIKEALNE